MVNRYPKCEQVKNPVTEQWNSTEALLGWRESWADKINHTLKQYGIVEAVSHLSYEAQGKNIQPTVHEGKVITYAERKLDEIYKMRAERGEVFEEQHTYVRELNLAIQEHNVQIKIQEEMQNLTQKMESIKHPVVERIRQAGQDMAEKEQAISRYRKYLDGIPADMRNEVMQKRMSIRKDIEADYFGEEVPKVSSQGFCLGKM